MNLQEAGLFTLQDKRNKWEWEKVKTNFGMIIENLNLVSPNNSAYVHGYFAPLSVRIIERLFGQDAGNPGLQNPPTGMSKGLRDHLKLLGVGEDKLYVPANEAKLFAPATTTGGVNLMPRGAPKKKKILVFFVGGITYAEIAALRFLQNVNPMFKIIIGTTSILSGYRCLNDFLGPEESGLAVSNLLPSK